MVKQRGIILAEVVLAIVLSSGLLAIIVGWQQRQQLHDTYNLQLAYARQLMVVLQNYQQEFGVYPQHLEQLQASGYWQQALPTLQQSQWQWQFIEPFLDIRAQLGSAGQARWLAAQLPDARANATELSIRMVQPAIGRAVDTSLLLHRVAVPEQPELNQLATHISMQGHDILNVGSLTAASITATTADISTIIADELRLGTSLWLDNTQFTAAGTQLTITATQLQLNGPVRIAGSLDLQNNNLTGVQQLSANQVTTQRLTSDTITASTLSTDQLDVNQLEVTGNLTLAEFQSSELQVDLLTANTLTATSLTAAEASVNELQANYVYATDVIAGARSIAENYALINSYQALWDQCVDVGGCQ